MVHDSVEQGHDKYNSFLSSMVILRVDAGGTEILILLLYFNSSSVGLEHKLWYNEIMSIGIHYILLGAFF